MISSSGTNPEEYIEINGVDLTAYPYSIETTGNPGWLNNQPAPGYNSEYNFSTKISHCRYCGILRSPGTISLNALPGICGNCSPKIMDAVMKELIPQTDEYCQDCFSHINACECPKKEAMKQLKK